MRRGPVRPGQMRAALWLWALLLPLVLLSACTGSRLFSTTVWAAPVPVDDAILLGTRDGDLIAVDRQSGAELWRVATQAAANRAGMRAIYGTPVTDGERAYVGGFDGVLYAVEMAPELAETERIAWSCAAGSPLVGGAAVAGDLVLVGSQKGILYAVERAAEPAGDACADQARWTFPTAGWVWAAPTVSGDLAYVGTLDGTLHAVRLRDGGEEWSFQAQAGIAMTPVVAGGVVYVGSFDRRLYALDARTGGARWPQPFEATNWFWAEPLVQGGRVYAPALDGYLYILDAATGAPVHEPVRTGGAIRGAPVLAGDLVFLSNEAGETWWVDTRTGEARAGGALAAAVYASPLAVGDSVYLYAQDGALYTVTPRVRQPARVYPLK